MTPLTTYQRHVLFTVARLGSIQAAADDLGVAASTVKNTLTLIHRRLGVRSTTAALYRVLTEEGEAA